MSDAGQGGAGAPLGEGCWEGRPENKHPQRREAGRWVGRQAFRGGCGVSSTLLWCCRRADLLFGAVCYQSAGNGSRESNSNVFGERQGDSG